MKSTLVRLHLGCWKRYIPGFVHIDLYDLPHIDYIHSVDTLPMFDNNSVDLIYISHVFEYFDREQAKGILREYWRVLRCGGTLRMAVPDFAALVEVYRNTNDLSNVLGPLYGRMTIEGKSGQNSMIYHRTVYDFRSLKSLLENCRFVNVRRYDWRQTVHKDYDDHSQAYFPHMEKENGLLISLNVEAQKEQGSGEVY